MLVKVALASGIPGIMLVLTYGQLVPQLFVEEFTLPFMNLPGCYFVTQLCFLAEFLGVCNFSWLLFHSVNSLFYRPRPHRLPGSLRTPSAGSSALETSPRSPVAAFVEDDPMDEDLPGASGIRTGWFDLLKHLWSTGVTLGAVVVVMYGISQHYSVLPVPVPALYIIFFWALALLFYLEGLMICIVATQYWNPEDFRASHPRAYQLHKIVNRPETVKKVTLALVKLILSFS
jgi:hypothetical protein